MKKILVAIALIFALNVAVFAEDMKKSEGKEQTMCAVKNSRKMSLNKFVKHDGYKIYFCCNNCIKSFKKNPKKYMAKLKKDGVKLEKAD